MTPGPVEEIQLENGFRALLLVRRNLPIVASSIWYRVGSRDERTGETGLSHFLEHMMFKGTERYAKGEIDLLTSKMGGSNNAFTSNDVTAYYFSLASDRWETALEIEADRMLACTLDEAEFAAEKKVVLEELAMGEDDPWRSLYQRAESQLWQVHPYHHPVIGWREELERLEVATMRDYYQRHYGPNRAFLVAVGDFDTDRVEKRIIELFGDLPATAEDRSRCLAEPLPDGERRSAMRSPGKIARMATGTPTCRMGERDDFVLDVIGSVLSTGRSSRLQSKLIFEEKMATSVTAFSEARDDPGGFWIAMELNQGQDPVRAEGLVRDEVAKLLRRCISRGEMRRALTQIRASFLFEEETAMDIAMRIGRYESSTQRGFGLIEEALEIYGSITPAEIKEVARRYLGPQRWSTVWSLAEDARARGAS